MNRDVVVLGAGVVGLTVASVLLGRGYRVHIVAEKTSPETTSDLASALWYPQQVLPKEEARAWALVSLRRFVEAAGDSQSGVLLRKGRKYFHRPMGLPWWASHVPQFRKLSELELGAGYRAGYEFVIPVIDPSIYLTRLLESVLTRGAKLHRRTITDLNDLWQWASTAINCTGLAARELVSDSELFPIRGLALKVSGYCGKEFHLDTDHPEGIISIIPHGKTCILGGTSEKQNGVTNVKEEEFTAIRQRCESVFPELRLAEVMGTQVGFRPGREQIRLEKENRNGNLLVHCYGHGGAGFTLSWGCAEAVAEILLSPI